MWVSVKATHNSNGFLLEMSSIFFHCYSNYTPDSVFFLLFSGSIFTEETSTLTEFHTVTNCKVRNFAAPPNPKIECYDS